ncbi:MAG: hypothetical protein LBH44_02560 [Treponema sp.]|jgi:hypothetical protein|nr:hypothetical protein [Treponema sp.]
MKKMGLFVIGLVVLGFFLIGCDPEPQDTGYTSTVKQLSDSRFNGVFFSSYDYLDGRRDDETLTFNGTNKAIYNLKEYTAKGDKDDETQFDYEMEINEAHDKYRKKLWSNEFSDWSQWYNYSFNPSGDLTTYWMGGVETYEKQSD